MIDGRRPIHYAADYGQKEIIEYLIQLDADVNVSFSLDSIKMVSSFGIITQSLDKHGISALLAAIWEGHIECCRLLISNGAKIDGRTPDGISYIDAAENVEIKRLLMATSWNSNNSSPPPPPTSSLIDSFHNILKFQ